MKNELKKISVKISAALVVFCVVLALFASCAKDGETGPKGDKGDTGASGAAGTNGTNGTNGVANVQQIDLTIHPNNWTYSSLYSEWHYDYHPSPDPAYGTVVLNYIMSGNGKQVMPFVDTFNNCRYTFADNLFWSPPYIQYQFTNFTTANVAPTYDKYVYLVLIPPARMAEHPNLDVSDYNAVKKAFNLKD